MREACQARRCSHKTGYWGKGSNNIPFSPVQHFSPQNERFLARSCNRLQGSACLQSKSVKKGGFIPHETTLKKDKKATKAKVVSSSCSSEIGRNVDSCVKPFGKSVAETEVVWVSVLSRQPLCPCLHRKLCSSRKQKRNYFCRPHGYYQRRCWLFSSRVCVWGCEFAEEWKSCKQNCNSWL